MGNEPGENQRSWNKYEIRNKLQIRMSKFSKRPKQNDETSAYN